MALRLPKFDPPLRARVLWKDPIRRDTLISEDSGLMARTFGTLTLTAALLGCMVLVIHADPARNYYVAGAIVAIELVYSVVCFTVYRRLPRVFFHVSILFGIAMICASASGEARAAAPVLSLCLIWIVLVANLFFSARAAVLYTALAAVSLGLVLYARDANYWQNYAIAGFVVFQSAGVVVGRLRSRLEDVATRLDREAKTDTVTGLPNRRGFNERCDLEVARATRDGVPLSLVVCDLDHFKLVNDRLGHDEGDIALREAARVIDGSVRSVDVVGRLGGEEFGIVLPGADGEEAMAIAERVRNAIREAFESHPVGLTVSCGVATFRSGTVTRQALLRSADSAMYEAKSQGRDRTIGAVSPQPGAGDGQTQLLAARSTK